MWSVSLCAITSKLLQKVVIFKQINKSYIICEQIRNLKMSLMIRTDVTAVKKYQKYILAGIGSSVFIYSKEKFKLLHRIQCLNGQKIYGFIPHEINDNVLVYGGKQFTIIKLASLLDGESDVKVVSVMNPIVCTDWLHSGAWLTDNTIAILTAHNTVQIWDINKSDIVSQYPSKENSILYSGLLLALQDGILVFAGTVFSEVIIHTPTEDKPFHYLKGHRGVIFSISADLNKRIMVTTSDDRSVRIWRVGSESKSNITANTIDYWRNNTITCSHEVYGHAARVMRSCITDDSIISVGEDSAICYWSYEGTLQKKYLTHQNGCIWSVDADTSTVVTGGGDCAVISHPLTTALYKGENDIFKFNENPKKIAFTARKNLVVLDDSDNLIYYNLNDRTETKYKLNHDSTYKLFSISDCKQLIAVGDMNGKLDVFTENCKGEALLSNLLDTSLDLGRLLSMHWVGNRHLVFCSEKGVITLISSRNIEVETVDNFILPACKERWLTSAAMNSNNKCLVVGDRCGNVHVYFQGNKNPCKTFSKVHGRYGPTSITIKHGEIITTGRDGTIKYFLSTNANKLSTKYMSSKDLEFQWVEKFIDKDEKIVCGFQERTFVVFDLKNHCKILEVPCGGGHRSWDIVRYMDKVGEDHNEFIKFVYIKNSDVHSHIFQMSKIIPQYVIKSSHSKEINCLKTIDSKLDGSVTFYVTGGEDTTLRVSLVDSDQRFQDEVVFKQLSNIRTLKLVEYDDGVLIVSAGGRAQICIRWMKIVSDNGNLKVLSEELVNFMVKGTDKERRNNQTWRNSTIDFDPETRIMDLDVILDENNRIIVYAGCSDAYLRMFSYSNKEFLLVGEIKHHNTCILKTVSIKIAEEDILITCTTRGEITMWQLQQSLENDIVPFFTTRTNKSGINSIDTVVLSDKEVLIATGGDDNAVILSLVEVPSLLVGTCVKGTWSTDKYHCSQVTGVKFVDEYLLTTSIDQRVTLSRWSVNDGICCVFLRQMFSDVADIQGLEVLEKCRDSITVCVYGKGMEVLKVPIRDG